MQRSKSLALMFLLGAALAGGVMGFAVSRAVVPADQPKPWDQRAFLTQFGRQLDLSPTQLAAVDSIMRWRHERIAELVQPVKPQIEAVKDSARARIAARLTPEQRREYDRMLAEMRAGKPADSAAAPARR